ncbi:acyl-CoA dehydrogenase family protein, partial [Mycobacterium avium]
MVGEDGQAWATLSQVFDLAVVALACEQVGGAAAVMESTIDYLKVRHQFGRAIGSFQAIKHRCADMLVELESARSAAAYASAALASRADDASISASIAKAYCSSAYYHIAAESIQMHGGIGFTWE